ncbi:MAG: 30S ribosomal protein S18 [Planctomycetes bacterium]|nr:30S ribosomal protein S18 [Planctomycetota bacterium]MBL7152753.1 30S ribosomal protein S18 [Phycisphaerae bacterium]
MQRSPQRNTQRGIQKRRGKGGSRRKGGFSGAREQTQCRFCRRGIKYVDYKDIETLSKLLTNRGKIYSRKRSGNCAGCQRKSKKAIKRARYMALLPFTN